MARTNQDDEREEWVAYVPEIKLAIEAGLLDGYLRDLANWSRDRFMFLKEKEAEYERDPLSNPAILGVYENSAGSVWRVVRNRANTGTYAKKMIVLEDPQQDSSGNQIKGRVKWEYDNGAVWDLARRPEWKMPLDRFQVLGIAYGICLRCGRELTSPNSPHLKEMVGPRCYEKLMAGEARI